MILSALFLGIMGSLHCMAMCGPLAFTIGQHAGTNRYRQLQYHLGRILTYTSLGALAGIFGEGIRWASGQQFLSIASGVILLIGLSVTWQGMSMRASGWQRILVRLKIKMSQFMGISSGNFLLFGIYNGLLPCGLTYVAVAGAMNAGSLLQGMLYMALFGMGTSPALGLVVGGSSWFTRLRWFSGKQVLTACTWVLAILLIVRGLDLGLPYLSPDLKDTSESSMTICN